jgi:hypothetical protein
MALTEYDLGRLLPEERLAFTMAAQMVAEDRNPGLNVTAQLVLLIERLLTQPETEDPRALTAEGAGPLLDPDCRDGKHGSCVGAPCECGCHPRPVHSMTIEMGNRCGATGLGSASSLAENVTCPDCRVLLDIQEAIDRG